MEITVLNQDEVRELLPMDECIEVMEAALASLARGEVLLPLRQITWLPDGRSALATMPAYAGHLGAVGVKVITIFPGNEGTELDAHQGAVLLFETERGRPLLLCDATEVTAIRTAAVSGVATRHLAREDARDLAILGSGTQARSHLEAMLAVRDVRSVRVWSRTEEHSRTFAERELEARGLTIEVAPTAEDAVRGADLVCTTTSARDPVLLGEWLAPGTHVNAVGFSGRDGREVDTEAVRRARLYVDRRESAVKEKGDVVIPIEEGSIGEDHIAGELGEVLIGTAPGRSSSEEITLFESAGLAIEDLASAHHLYEKAKEKGIGTRVELGGQRA
ncbi:MAG TPA: ornithine cyclodeaminase family protein [Actinomycetota bacterium]|jgi:ornithine cyclodeaminase|nr:ornithine cyclodeaminase family protein [Actinomycetota bacterium]